MLICCVNKGDKYESAYVQKLQSGVLRHLSNPDAHTFVCFTDRPVPGVLCENFPERFNLPTWWSKLILFLIDEPALYFDLDVVITGDLSPLLEWKGFGILKDPWQPMFNSSVMRLTGQEGHVLSNFKSDVIERCKSGDQEWITEQMPNANTFPKEWVPSYKADRCQDKVPDGAIAVNFHGRPKPHDCGGWVPDYWR